MFASSCHSSGDAGLDAAGLPLLSCLEGAEATVLLGWQRGYRLPVYNGAGKACVVEVRRQQGRTLADSAAVLAQGQYKIPFPLWEL